MTDLAPSISFEFFPPKDEAGEDVLWQTLKDLAPYSPDFVSVTYGAGGSTQERTFRIASEVIARTGAPTYGHLTLVGSTEADLINVLDEYQRIGLRGVLALRGDPVGGPTAEWTPTPGGYTYAHELVELIANRTQLDISVAAFPDVHPASQGNFLQDIQVLLRKEQAGATSAITQFVFDSGRFEALSDALESHGSALKLYPGIMPVTSYPQIVRMLELSGGYMPKATRLRFARYQNDEASLRELGIEIAVQICEDVVALGATGVHFYTLNKSAETLEVLKNVSFLGTYQP